MRLLPILTLIPFLASCSLAATPHPISEVFVIDAKLDDLEPMGPNFGYLYQQINDAFNPEVTKRSTLEDTITQLLISVNESGIISDILHEISSSAQQMNTLTNYIFQVLVSALTSTAIEGLNITINATEILKEVLASGILQSTIASLFLVDDNRDLLSDDIGVLLQRFPWIAKLVNNIAYGSPLTMKLIFDTIQTTVSKVPGIQENVTTNATTRLGKRELRRFSKRANSTAAYAGTLNSFINNIVGSAIGSQLATTSFSTILSAVKASGIATPIVFLAVGDQQVQGMVGFIGNKLYNLGVLDQVPLDSYFQNARKKGYLSHGLEIALTHPTYAPQVARWFQRMQYKGTFRNVQLSLFGP